MAQAKGYSCDVCNTFGVSPGNGMLRPQGWLGVQLPGGEGDPDRGMKDVCSNRCLKNLANERLKVEGGGELPYKRKSRLSPELKQYLAAHGIIGQAIGGKVNSHKGHLSPASNCVICDWEIVEGQREKGEQDA